MTISDERELVYLCRWFYHLCKCRAKKKFFSEEAAKASVSREGREHGSRTPPKLRVYPCRYCGFWHLTSLRPRQPAPIMEAA